ncbi:MAG TPA: mechanosensitive ion channel domain-containing protein [Pedobacter sp.]|uniref:mechanosensitive ion channel family protein n=1 Tax=Pedobacter sp. TaxID=1411316 RepID=UPI002C477194|nr:mechanosensitive ion channel domain-containing protein [Pedobacter sp.]HMI03944.1 mechanosensitive ion channel domain-containing protein [Pedobacter sp.]
MIEDRERKTGKELLMILIKTAIYLTLLYFYINKPHFYVEYPRIDQIARGLMVFLGPSLVISILRLVVIYWYIRKHRFKNNIKDNFILGINRIVSILNAVLFMIALIIFSGQDPREFITSISIVAAAIALTFKDYVTNMINGLIIMFSDRLSLGDHIKIGELEGKILDITLINMILQNEDSDMVIIPNSLVFSSVIVNQSKQNTKKLSVEFEMSLDNGYTPEYLEKYLDKNISGFTENIVAGGLTVKTISINKDVAVFKAMVLLKHYDKFREREIRRTINTALIRLSATLKKEEGPQAEKEAAREDPKLI